MHQFRKLAFWVLTLSALFFTFGCAQSELDRKLDDKLAQEKPITSPTEMRAQRAALVDQAPGLTDDQRAKLHALGTDTHKKITQINSQSEKLREVLVKDLISPKYNETQAENLKTRLSDLDDQRLGVIFSAVNKAGEILGRSNTKHKSAKDIQVDEKIASETIASSPIELRKEITNDINEAKNLNVDQRAQLLAIRDEARSELKDLRAQSMKLSSVLIKDVVGTENEPNGNKDEVALIKKKLKDIEYRKMRVIFSAVGRSNEVMGRVSSARALDQDEAGWSPDRIINELDATD